MHQTIKAKINKLESLSTLMDSQFSFYGFRFGLDGILGLFPVIGDMITGLISFYIVWQGYLLGVRGKALFRLVTNVAIDVSGGYIPIIGDVFDFTFKANKRNLEIIKAYF